MGYRNELKICYANDEDVIHYLKVARTSCNNTNVSLQPYGSSYCKNALQAHKEVLAAASPFLAEILEVSCDCDTTISFSDYTFNQLKLLLDYIYTGEIQASRAMMDEFEDCLKDLRILGTHSYVSVDAESAEENLSAFKESISTDYDVSESEVQENPLEKCTVKNKVNKNKKVVLTQNIVKVEEEEIYVELPEEFNEDEATTSKWEEVYAVPSLDCDVCNITCESYEELRKHQQTHTDKRPYVCPICQKSFRHLNVLKTHSRVHTGEKPFKCDTCNRAFAHKSTLNEHMNLHSEERPYECTACQRRFKERKSLRSHRCQQDQVEEVFQCEVCGRHFINRKALALHRIHHEAEGKGKEPHEKPFLCDVCARGFRNKYLLKAHQMTHSDEKRFECPVCHKRFSHKKTLQVHSSSHTVNKSSYGCAYCPMSFRYVANLDKHERIHTGHKPFECQLCTSTFRQKSGLREHMLTHTRSPTPTILQDR